MQQTTIDELAKRCEKQLHLRLPKSLEHIPLLSDKSAEPQILPIIEYTLYAQSKMMRPVLLYVLGDVLGVNLTQLDATACAIELMHTSSLIHDDLPAMDNDSLRRGKPCSHLHFDEASAILAGDAAMLASSLVIAQDEALDEKLRLELIAMLHWASLSMIEGQFLDVHCDTKDVRHLKHIEYINRLKTAALIGLVWEAAATIAGAPCAQRDLMKKIGEHLGLAFQLQDDLQDQEIKDGEMATQEIINQQCEYVVLALTNESGLAPNSVRKLISILSHFIKNERLAIY